MKKTALVLLAALSLLASGCVFFPYAPTAGSSETKFLRNTVSYDLVYLEGSVKAYRSGGSYYYFKDGKLVKVAPQLVSADQI